MADATNTPKENDGDSIDYAHLFEKREVPTHRRKPNRANLLKYAWQITESEVLNMFSLFIFRNIIYSSIR